LRICERSCQSNPMPIPVEARFAHHERPGARRVPPRRQQSPSEMANYYDAWIFHTDQARPKYELRNPPTAAEIAAIGSGFYGEKAKSQPPLECHRTYQQDVLSSQFVFSDTGTELQNTEEKVHIEWPETLYPRAFASPRQPSASSRSPSRELYRKSFDSAQLSFLMHGQIKGSDGRAIRAAGRSRQSSKTVGDNIGEAPSMPSIAAAALATAIGSPCNENQQGTCNSDSNNVNDQIAAARSSSDRPHATETTTAATAAPTTTTPAAKQSPPVSTPSSRRSSGSNSNLNFGARGDGLTAPAPVAPATLAPAAVAALRGKRSGSQTASVSGAGSNNGSVREAHETSEPVIGFEYTMPVTARRHFPHKTESHALWRDMPVYGSKGNLTRLGARSPPARGRRSPPSPSAAEAAAEAGSFYSPRTEEVLAAGGDSARSPRYREMMRTRADTSPDRVRYLQQVFGTNPLTGDYPAPPLPPASRSRSGGRLGQTPATNGTPAGAGAGACAGSRAAEVGGCPSAPGGVAPLPQPAIEGQLRTAEPPTSAPPTQVPTATAAAAAAAAAAARAVSGIIPGLGGENSSSSDNKNSSKKTAVGGSSNSRAVGAVLGAVTVTQPEEANNAAAAASEVDRENTPARSLSPVLSGARRPPLGEPVPCLAQYPGQLLPDKRRDASCPVRAAVGTPLALRVLRSQQSLHPVQAREKTVSNHCATASRGWCNSISASSTMMSPQRKSIPIECRQRRGTGGVSPPASARTARRPLSASATRAPRRGN